MRRLAISMICAAVLSACSWMNSENPLSPSNTIVNVGDTLPSFTICLHDSTMLSTADLLGRPSVLVFFATTCPDCQRELPTLNQRYLMHGRDTAFVLIAREQQDSTVATYWQEHSLSLPFSAQTDRRVYSLFAKRGIPRTYIADSNTIVCQAY